MRRGEGRRGRRVRGRRPDRVGRRLFARGFDRGGRGRSVCRVRGGRRFRGRGLEGGLERVQEGAFDRAVVAEAHFALGRVHVDVHLPGRQGQEENGRRAHVARTPRIGLAQGVGDGGGGRRASVDENVLVAPGGQGAVGALQESGHADGRTGVRRLDREEGGEEVGAEQIAHAVGELFGGRQAVEFASVDGKRESDLRMGEGVRGEHRLDMAFLRRGRVQELAPRGDVAEKVAHFHARSRGTARRAHVAQCARVDDELRAFVCVRPACRQRETGYGRDGGHGFAAEAERVDAFDVVNIQDFGGRLALERQKRVLFRHAAPVVLHGNELASARRNGDADVLCAGVQGVFDEFLDDRSRSLDDLSRGDLVRHVERQHVDMSIAVKTQSKSPSV